MPIHDWETAPEQEWRRFIADHLDRMSTNQMNLSDKLDTFLINCNATNNTNGKQLSSMQTNLKWLWICGGLVVSGIGIAMAELWRRVF